MVDARERHGDHLERVGAAHDLGRIGVIGDHDHVGADRATGELGGVRRLLGPVDELVAGLLDGARELADARLGDAERLEQGYLHSIVSL